MPDKNSVHMEIIQYQPSSEKDLWECNGTTIDECLNAFVHAPIFNGKTFWEAEKKIDWVRWSSLQACSMRSFSSAVTLTLMMCVFRFRGVSVRFSRACTFGLFVSAIFDLL